MAFEYLSLKWELNFSSSTITIVETTRNGSKDWSALDFFAVMDTLGAAQWELVSVVMEASNLSKTYLYYFKRVT